MSNMKKVALDIGNKEIKILVGEINSSFDKIAITNYVKVRSKGLRKSIIEDVDALTESIQEAVKKIETADFKIEKLSFALGGAGIKSETVNIKLSFPEKEIIAEDIDELYRQAKKKIFSGREEEYRVLYSEIYNKRVDASGIVKQPIGMFAKELKADVHLIYLEETYIEKFHEIVNKIGIDLDRVYLNSFASAKGTLDKETKKMGVAHVDIGYGTTDLLLMKNGKVIYAETIPLGEWHYISDIRQAIDITFEEAEEVLKKFKNKEFENDNTIKIGSKKISIRNIKDLVQGRTADLVDFITLTIEKSGFNGHLAKGISLTGGTVHLEGVAEQIASKSGYVVRKKLPIQIKGIKDISYSDAVAIGVFLEDMEIEYRDYIEKMKSISNEKVETENSITEKSRIEELDEILEEEKQEEVKRSFLGKIIKEIVDLF